MRRLRSKADGPLPGIHARIWRNLKASADRCLALTPRRAWIAPVEPDPVYENLYDRFYAIMGDLAVTEHLAFAYAYSGDRTYGDAARRWVLAGCRAWQWEADGRPDGGKAYAVCRLLKGLAVGYDCLWSLWTEEERREVRDTLARIGQAYYDGYFTTPAVAGPAFHTHHAVVEWASFGVAALALLGEVPPAEEWLAATVRKFEEHLLLKGLAPDGAQVEGATFWASTMQYRLFFMDALRRVTGRDLFARYRSAMNADLALASIAAEKRAGHDEEHQTVVLAPSYGQLNYYAPALLALAREYRRPIYQHLALWDRTLGALQETRYVTPRGEQLRFELGGYAYAWYDPTVPDECRMQNVECRREGNSSRPNSALYILHSAFSFPSVDEAYLRASWRPGGIVVGVRRGEVVVHAGGRVVLAEPAAWHAPVRAMCVQRVSDDGERASIECADDEGAATLSITLHRPDRLVIRRRAGSDWHWWCQRGARRTGDGWAWGRGARRVRLRVLSGTVTRWEPEGAAEPLAVGNGLLKLRDPAPQRYPRITVAGDAAGVIEIEVRLTGWN